MILYDSDDKLCVASPTQVRLWDFVDGREDAEIWSSEEFSEDDKVKAVFINENSIAIKGEYVFVVVTEMYFYIFVGRLEFQEKHKLESKYGSVLVVAFNNDTSEIYLGTSFGYIISWDYKK